MDSLYGKDDFYCRQVALPFIGKSGQAKINNKRILVIGAGGLGHGVLPYLAAAGFGQIKIMDDDRVEVTNLHRQVLFNFDDIGKKKAFAVAQKLKLQNPFIDVEGIASKLTQSNVSEFVKEADIVLDCTDNFKAKFLLHDVCFFFKKDLILASVYQKEGILSVFKFSEIDKTQSACLRCLYPQAPSDGCVGVCSDVGVMGVLPGLLGMYQANEAIKIAIGQKSDALASTIIINLDGPSIDKLAISKNQDCPICSGENVYSSIDEILLLDKNNFGISKTSDIYQQATVVDVRKSDFSNFNPEKDKTYVFICDNGKRAQAYVQKMRNTGHENIYYMT